MFYNSKGKKDYATKLIIGENLQPSTLQFLRLRKKRIGRERITILRKKSQRWECLGPHAGWQARPGWLTWLVQWPAQPGSRRALLQLQLQREQVSTAVLVSPIPLSLTQTFPFQKSMRQWVQGGLPYMATPPALSETPMLFQVVKFWIRTKPSLHVPSLYNHVSVVGEEIQSDPGGSAPIILSPFS